jgi:hypothetical protein
VKQRNGFRISPVCKGLIASLAFLFASLVAAPGIGAQSPAFDSSSGLKAELQPLSFFLGEWNCEGEFVASKKAIASHIAIAPDLEGSWLVFRWDDKEPNRFHALELWGFDKAANHFTNFIHDNFGGARLFNAPGWDGDTLIWTGNLLAAPPTLDERFVIERKSPKEFVISWDVRKPQTDWTTGDRLICRK